MEISKKASLMELYLINHLQNLVGLKETRNTPPFHGNHKEGELYA